VSSIEARTRLGEVVQAIRYINHFEFGEWCRHFPNLYDRVSNGPFSLTCGDLPLTKLVRNLEIELQLRTAELLLAIEDEKENKEAKS